MLNNTISRSHLCSKRSLVATTISTSTSTASKQTDYGALMIDRPASDKRQISDVTMAFGPAKKHENFGMRMRIEKPPGSPKKFKHIVQAVLPRNRLAHKRLSQFEQTSSQHPLRQHPVSSVESDHESEYQDQGSDVRNVRKGQTRACPAASSVINHEGWTPWSPEDGCTYHDELNRDRRCFTRRHSEGGPMPDLRNEPSAASPPAYYDPDPAPLPSYHDFQNMHDLGSPFAMPLRKTQRQLSILSNDSCEKPSPPERNPKRLTMSTTPPHANRHGHVDGMIITKYHDNLGGMSGTKHHGSVRKSAINIIRLRPNPLRPERSSSLAQIQAQPSPLGSHPSAIEDTGEFPMPPVPTKSVRRLSPTANVKVNRKDRPFDVDPADQHKTNVRRPPKGIQHWFDAYISSEDEDDSDDGRVIDNGGPEPQELPAEEVPRPVYTLPERGSSLGVDHTARRMSRLPSAPASVCINTLRSPIGSDYSNSIQSSHCRGGRRTLGVSRRLGSTDLGQQSVLSTSSSDYSSDYEDDDDDVPGLPTIRDSIRDSILDDRHFEVASAASVRVQRLSPPGALNGVRGPQCLYSRSVDDLQTSQSYATTPPVQHEYPSSQHESSRESGGVGVTLRRLNGTSSAHHSARSATPPVPDAPHVVAVTDEEMIVLEIMRKKRAKMQQASFTEFLQRKRNDEMRREHIHQDQADMSREGSFTGARNPVDEMQRQLEDIRKAQVDADFQIERFLGVSSANQPSNGTHTSNPYAREDLLLPATVYSPSGTTAKRSMPQEERRRSEESLIDVQRRVEQFIATQGAVPPLNSIRTMRRPSHQALSPTHAVEEAMPPVPPLRKPRTASSGAEGHGLQHKVSVIHSSQSGMHRTSPVSAFPSSSSSANDFAPAGPYQGSPGYATPPERPRTASSPVNRRVKFQRSLPRINTDESLDVQRSSLEDVLDGWRELGGRGFTKSSGMTSQRV